MLLPQTVEAQPKTGNVWTRFVMIELETSASDALRPGTRATGTWQLIVGRPGGREHGASGRAASDDSHEVESVQQGHHDDAKDDSDELDGQQWRSAHGRGRYELRREAPHSPGRADMAASFRLGDEGPVRAGEVLDACARASSGFCVVQEWIDRGNQLGRKLWLTASDP
jgi:hypothetical protein